MANGEIKPRYGFTSNFTDKSNGWGDAVNSFICKMDSLLYPSIDGYEEPPQSGDFAGQQYISPADQCLYTWDGLLWDKCISKVGMVALDRINNKFLYFNGTEWVDQLDSIQLKQYLEANAASFYGWSSGAVPPSGAPTGCFPFYLDTADNEIYIYNYNNSTWYPLGSPSSNSSAGVASAGNLIEADANGLIDNSWLDLSTYVGTISQNSLGIFGTSGKIDCNFLPVDSHYVTEIKTNAQSIPQTTQTPIDWPQTNATLLTNVTNFGDSTLFRIVKKGRYSIKASANVLRGLSSWHEIHLKVTSSDGQVVTGPSTLFAYSGSLVNTNNIGASVEVDLDFQFGTLVAIEMVQSNQLSESAILSNAYISITKIREII